MTTGKPQSSLVESSASVNPLEQPGYFEVPGAYLYTVLHGVANPQARVLLVGSCAAERHLSYIPWVRWARYLAARGVECLRYDYRGVGESTGVFEEMSFGDWVDDVERLARWLKSRPPDVPVILHGLELGGLLAAKIFETGLGEGLLLWAPPLTANQALRATLLRRVALDNAFKYGSERQPAANYLRQLESGQPLDVDGFRWSGRLWRESLEVELPMGIRESDSAAGSFQKPVKIVKPEKLRAPLVKGSSVGYEAINRDFSGLFAENFEWIAAFQGLLAGSRQ